MSSLPSPPSTIEFIDAMIASYARLLAEPLVPANVPTDETAAWLYASADFSVLAHDTSKTRASSMPIAKRSAASSDPGTSSSACRLD
jgi:hypothetical protein